MAEIIPFPARREEKPEPAVHIQVTGEEAISFNECSGPIHVFDSIDMPCRCGEEVWPKHDSAS